MMVEISSDEEDKNGEQFDPNESSSIFHASNG
jgi:hypothetical protein